MIKKFGKQFDINKINRNLVHLREMADECKRDSDRLFLSKGETGCRICGSKTGKEFLTVYSRYRYYECSECGSIYLDGLPDIENMYVGDDNVNGNVYTDDTYNERISMIAIPKVKWILDVCLKQDVSVETWCDIGSGGGEILQALTKESVHGVGIESDKYEYEFALQKGLEVKNLRVDYVNEEVSEIISQSDVVSFFNVLEHIPEPGRFIDYMARCMKEGAVLAFEVPKHPSLASFANYTGSQFIYRHIVPPVHLSVFSEKGIDFLLKDKFEIMGKWYFGQGYVDVINNAMLTSNAIPNQIYEDVLSISNKVQAVIDEQGLSDQIMIIAKKK